jgi:polysaccharide biosynthesis transport protein
MEITPMAVENSRGLTLHPRDQILHTRDQNLQSRELTLVDMVGIYKRRRTVVYGTTLVLVALAAIYCLISTRRYEATGSIQIQKSSADSAGYGSLLNNGAADTSDSVSQNLEMQTQANILQSDSLALGVIKTLNLENTYDFRPHWNPVSWVMGLFSPGGKADPVHVPIEDAPRRRAHALSVFSKNLTIKPVAGTRVIDISYTSSDRDVAAAVVNTLTKGLLDYSFQTRYSATNETSKWLSDQLGTLRKNSEDLQAKVIDLQRQSGVYSTGGVDPQGHDQSYSAVVDRLQQATTAITAAEQSRIMKEAIAKAAQSGNGELLSGLAGNSTTGGNGATNNSLIVIQNLRQQQAAEEAALGEAKAKYGSEYPKIAEMEGNIAGLEHSIEMEANRLKGRAQNDYFVAQQTEIRTRQEYEDAKKAADVVNSKAIEFAIVRQEAEQSRTLYEDLLKSVNEAGVLAGLRSSNITVIDPGRVPAKPAKPNIPILLGGSVAGGIFLGCLAALLIDTLDRKVHSISTLEQINGGMLLGALPLEKPLKAGEVLRPQLTASSEVPSSYVEVIKSIRTALLLSETPRPQVVLITSSIAGEGKSTCALNLAAVSARSGKKTLLVDADMHCGSVSERLWIPSGPGLSELLSGKITNVPITAVEGIKNLDVLVAGDTHENSADLLGSDMMRMWLERWREEYDLIVLDGVPVLPMMDAVVLNTMCDATILLARSYMTEQAQIERSYSILKQGGDHYVGIVMNALKPTDNSYYGYYGYRGNSYKNSKGVHANA